MEKLEVGRFYATSFDNNVIEFIVYNDKTMDCPTLKLKNINQIELKPRFILWGKGYRYTHEAKIVEKYKSSPELIAKYDIDEELFLFLKQNRMIYYSTDMAYLYDFSIKKGYDKDRGVGSPYKWAKKKGPILVKQKKGQFN